MGRAGVIGINGLCLGAAKEIDDRNNLRRLMELYNRISCEMLQQFLEKKEVSVAYI